MDPLIVIAAGFGGLLLGSFGNVVVHRVPRGASIVSPPSACPGCGTELRARDNIPLISWLLLRGRCRSCGVAISPRYPALEVGMAAAFALTAATAGDERDLILALPLMWSFICLAVIDLEHKRLPDALTLPTLSAGVALAGVVAALGPGMDAFIRALLCASAAFVVFLSIAILVPAGFGLGDVKLAPSLALLVGMAPRGAARTFTAFLLAFLIGAAVGVAMIAAGRAGRKTALPFGPFLVLGTLIVAWTGDALVEVWLGP
jgi:leader peptidase (prepilin peptidase)/N-methyltransferase